MENISILNGVKNDPNKLITWATVLKGMKPNTSYEVKFKSDGLLKFCIKEINKDDGRKERFLQEYILLVEDTYSFKVNSVLGGEMSLGLRDIDLDNLVKDDMWTEITNLEIFEVV